MTRQLRCGQSRQTADTRSLLRWEYVATRHLVALGFPVATPPELILGDSDVLVSDFVMDDGRDADQVALGALLLQLHRSPPPPNPVPAAHGLPSALLVPYRIGERFAELTAFVASLPAAPPLEQLTAVLAARPARHRGHARTAISSEAPHAEFGPRAVDRLREVHLRLSRELES